MPDHFPPQLTVDRTGRARVSAAGAWQVGTLSGSGRLAAFARDLESAARQADAEWDLSGITALDHIGAQVFWNAWQRRRPRHLALAPRHEDVFRRLEDAAALQLPVRERHPLQGLRNLYRRFHAFVDHVVGFIALLGQLTLDLGRFLAQPLRGPWKEISASVYHIGYQALGITALVGFLIGIVLSYLSSQQLHTFGGDVYIVDILGMSIVRELGPLLAAILVAGRSGSSITAQLGVMRVTEELDAMLVMGLPHGFRLVMPRVLALAVSMPLLVIWTDAMALAGGIVAAQLELNLSPTYFLRELPDAVPIANYWIGLGKGVVFGALIALVACHFGLRIQPNTESLGQGTTLSVVTAITVVILADAVFAIVFSDVGFYW